MLEYPPLLRGGAEEQLRQLRAYLVRLQDDWDQALQEGRDAAADPARQEALARWQLSVDAALAGLRAALRAAPLVQHGAAAASGPLRFPLPYAAPPAVFVTAGAVSELSERGFTLTTTAPAQWIAVGERR